MIYILCMDTLNRMKNKKQFYKINKKNFFKKKTLIKAS